MSLSLSFGRARARVHVCVGFIETVTDVHATRCCENSATVALAPSSIRRDDWEPLAFATPFLIFIIYTIPNVSGPCNLMFETCNLQESLIRETKPSSHCAFSLHAIADECDKKIE